MPRPSKQAVLPSAEDRFQKLEADVSRLGKEVSRIQEALATLANALTETNADRAEKPKTHLTSDGLIQELAALLESNRQATKQTIEQTLSEYLRTQPQGMPLPPPSRRRTSKGDVLVNDGLAAVAGTRDAITTDEAAALLNFKANTLRKWACHENGPIRPVRIHGRLGWRVADIAALLNEDKP